MLILPRRAFLHRAASLLVAAPAIIIPKLARAQVPMTGAGLAKPATGGGGGGSVALFASGCAHTGGANPWTVVSGATFVTGTYVLGVMSDRNGGGSGPIAAPVIKTVTATQVGTTVSDGNTNAVNLWRADVIAGTGDITISGNTSAAMACAAWALTGISSSTPAQVAVGNGFAVQVADPQTVTLTSLAAGSVVVAFIGRNFPGTPSQNPTSWAAVTRDSGSEQTDATGNGAICAGASGSGLSGTISPAATANAGQSWLYSGLIAAAWN